MATPQILILGGYGNTGRPLAQLLLQESDARLVIAGRNVERAKKTAIDLNAISGEDRAGGVYADASDFSSLRQALEGIDLVVVASSTSQYVTLVAKAAMEAGVDYLDIQYSTEKITVLNSLRNEIERAGCCFITDGGFHPGLPAALIRYVAQYFDQLEVANVGSVIKIDWAKLEVGNETMDEFVREFLDFQAIVYQGGEWRDLGALSMLKPSYMDFEEPFGRQYGIPMSLEEMRALPELYPGLQETGFYVGGFNWFVDWLVSPLAWILLKLFPRKGVSPASALLGWGLRTFSKPPYGTLLKVDARGVQADLTKRLEMSVYHSDGYLLTAIPVAACLLQYLDGGIRKPGLWYQALLVEPDRLISDLRRMGVEVRLQDQEGRNDYFLKRPASSGSLSTLPPNSFK